MTFEFVVKVIHIENLNLFQRIHFKIFKNSLIVTAVLEARFCDCVNLFIIIRISIERTLSQFSSENEEEEERLRADDAEMIPYPSGTAALSLVPNLLTLAL